jgi:hypothetical protein
MDVFTKPKILTLVCFLSQLQIGGRETGINLWSQDRIQIPGGEEGFQAEASKGAVERTG